MKGKTLFVNLIAFILMMLTQYTQLFSEHTQAWMGIVVIVLTAVLNSDFFKSGTFPAGWTTATYIINAMMIVIQIFNAFGANHILPPDVVNYVILSVNTFIMLFIKDYGSGLFDKA